MLTKLKKYKRPLLLAFPLILILFLKDGPYGPPVFTDHRGGDFIVSAPVFFATDETAKNYANTACLSRWVNASSHTVIVEPPEYIYLGLGIRIPIKPKWVTAYCSP